MNNENQTEQASISVGRDVKDGIIVAGKDHTINVNITQSPPEKPQDEKPKPEDSRFLFLIALILVFTGWYFIQKQPITNVNKTNVPSVPTQKQAEPTLNPFKEEIYGIIVAQFNGNTEEQKNKGKEIQATIQSTLNARFKELGINDADTRKSSTLFESHDQARDFGKKYQAQLVIWGDVTLLGIIPNLTTVNQNDFISKVIKSDTTILKDSLSHTALATVSDIRFPDLTDEPTILVSFVTGLKYFRQENYEKAIEYFTYSLSEFPTKYINNSHIFVCIGSAKLFMKDYEKAIDDYRKAIEINPKNDLAYNFRGVTYSVKGEYDKAIADYNRAIEINPKDEWAYTNRGIFYHNKGEYDKAIADYNRAIEINPKDYSAYTNRGIFYHNKGEYDKAIADYNRAIEINPKHGVAYKNIAWLLASCPDDKHRDGIKAIEFANKALELKPDDPENWDTLAMAYAEAGKFEDAVKTQEKAISLLSEKDKDAIIRYTEHLNSYKAKKPWREKKEPK